jgi:putative component of membrane protein insertase Oxa1/YidC/SpoIIIJ protein YidD
MQSIQHYGVIRGVWMGARRLARCHPWAEGGVDDVPVREHEHVAITGLGFVVAHGHGKG